jgi:hypothetical protein
MTGSWPRLHQGNSATSSTHISVIKLITLLCSYLYTLFLAMDANFKLKGKERGIKDFELDPGWGSYVQNDRYQAHVGRHVEQPEVKGNFLLDV